MSSLIGRPTICLNMIVKDEAHIVHEVIEAVAPYIDCWVIVDTGSQDGTQDVITAKMAALGIPGQLHQRPWKDFGHNRTEALALAQGHADYIWVMDADDTLSGTLDLSNLTADGYEMRVVRHQAFWRLQLFRSGVAWRYTGVLHEYALCDTPHTRDRLEGDYQILSRTLGARGRDPQAYHRDCEVLLAEIQRNPADARSVFYLANTYHCLGDYAHARTWWERYVEIGDRYEMVYSAMLRLCQAMEKLGEPWAQVLDAYLQAWAYRPSRAEALTAIAMHYRDAEQYELGYLFAARAAQIPLPDDTYFVQEDVYRWRAADEQAVCASWILERQEEAVQIWSRLLTRTDIPDVDRQRMLDNHDHVAGQLLRRAADN